MYDHSHKRRVTPVTWGVLVEKASCFFQDILVECEVSPEGILDVLVVSPGLEEGSQRDVYAAGKAFRFLIVDGSTFLLDLYEFGNGISDCIIIDVHLKVENTIVYNRPN